MSDGTEFLDLPARNLLSLAFMASKMTFCLASSLTEASVTALFILLVRKVNPDMTGFRNFVVITEVKK